MHGIEDVLPKQNVFYSYRGLTEVSGCQNYRAKFNVKIV